MCDALLTSFGCGGAGCRRRSLGATRAIGFSRFLGSISCQPENGWQGQQINKRSVIPQHMIKTAIIWAQRPPWGLTSVHAGHSG